MVELTQQDIDAVAGAAGKGGLLLAILEAAYGFWQGAKDGYGIK